MTFASASLAGDRSSCAIPVFSDRDEARENRALPLKKVPLQEKIHIHFKQERFNDEIGS